MHITSVSMLLNAKVDHYLVELEVMATALESKKQLTQKIA